MIGAGAALGALGLALSLNLSAPVQKTAQADAPKVSFAAPVASFTLPDPSGQNVTVGNWNSSKATVILFVATRCPVSKDYDERMATLARDYEKRGVRFFGVNSNKQEPADEVAAHARDKGFTFPVLKDLGNKVADRFDARVTPEVFVVDAKGNLAYKGQIDNNRIAQKADTQPLRAALDAVISGKAVPERETQAFGCTIKRVN